jgi:hypothetical protein
MRWQVLWVVWVGALALATSAGCNSILGNKLYELADDAGQPGDRDATTPGDDRGGGAGQSEAVSDDGPGGPGDDGPAGDGGCTSLADIHTCGSCTTDCAQYPFVSASGLGCNGGRCTYSCLPGHADCGDAGTGCTTVLSLPSSCGACGVTCMAPTPVCTTSEAGVETCASSCPSGQTNCSNTCSNLTTDSSHCGTCATACPSSQTCDGGVCLCPSTSSPDLCGTACTNKLTDGANCGSCGHTCTGGQTCQAGVCACPAGQNLCSGTCVNLSGTDVNSCGGCGTSCAALPHVSATGLACSAGKCSYQCAPGYADCGSTGTGCNTPLGTASNCSACGATCSGATPSCGPAGSTYACSTGCASGQANCSGTCATLASDGNNCGTCGHACPAAETCQSSACACPSTSSPNFCGSVCTNTQTDTSNCGSCSHACPSAQTCAAGTCTCPSSVNPTLCGTACTNTQTDSSNCGSCGKTCTVTGQQCSGGACGCPGGQIVCGSVCQTANACGGCGTLSPGPNTKCGTCGTYVCSADKTSVSCNDPGTTNSCPTWCTSQAVPSGVATSDYQCVDFDNGLPSSSTWPQTVNGSGALSRSTAAADSAPDSLAVSVGGSNDNAAITWNDVGSTPIKSYSVIVAINPTTSLVTGSGGNIQLLCVNTGSNSTCLYYTNGGADGNQNSPFTGISAYSAYNGNSVIFGPCALSVTSLQANLWNTVEIDMTIGSGSGAISGTGKILINGTVANSACAGAFMNSTTLNVVVGPEATEATFPWSGYFDNITVAVKR